MTVSGTGEFANSDISGGGVDAAIANISFADTAGNPLPDARLVAAPEPAAVILLFTMVVAVLFIFQKNGQRLWPRKGTF
jgi:hypothetical protein